MLALIGGLLVLGFGPPVSAQSQVASVAAVPPYSFVVNFAGSVTEYAKGVNGNQAPIATISGSNTGLNGPVDAAVDSAGDLFVVNSTGNSVTEYANGANGNQAPIATISGPSTGFDNPIAVALHPSGYLFVANFSGNSVTEYAPGANGNQPPIATISGADTGLSGPVGLALDSAGELFVANNNGNSVTEYPQASNGDQAPIATVSGDQTQLNSPDDLALDPSENVFVANNGGNSVTEYAKGASGNKAPIAAISGSATGLSGVGGVAVDSSANLLVANQDNSTVTEYAPGANGDQAPSAKISGSATGLNDPVGVTVVRGTAPGAPTVGQATAANARASVAFTPPASNGGAPIASYSATAKDVSNPANGDQTATGVGSPITVTGLTNGDSYTLSVTATNALGTGPASGPSNAVTPSVAAGTSYSYVTNSGNNSVTEYAKDASGDQTPTATISGPATGLASPVELALDSSGDLFVANAANNSVTEYANDASGNQAPAATISGPATGLGTPVGLALDSSGNLFVANNKGNSVTEYAKGATGNQAPTATLSGNSTGISAPQGLALDSAGDEFVTNYNGNSVTEYVAGASGNQEPIATISGSNTGIGRPGGLALDSSGNLFVANLDGSSVTEYAKGATGNQAPAATISGANTQLNGPLGLAFDSSGNLFVGNLGGNSVTEYAPGANGNQAPLAGISGSATGLNSPQGVAVFQPTATAPGAPTIVQASAGNAQASVTFSPPSSDGGSPITSYTATATDLTNSAHGGQTASGAASPLTVSGLTNGDSYTVTVTATNSVGPGPASAPSNAVTPSAPSMATSVVSSQQFGVPNQTDEFGVAPDGTLQVRWVQGSGTWHAPLAISTPGFAPAGSHLAASPQFGVPNQTDVFVVGNNGAIDVFWVQGAGTWQGPLAIPATPATSTPGAGLAASAQLGVANQTDVFVVDDTKAINVSWVSGAGTWRGPLPITQPGFAPAGSPLVTSPQFGVANQTDVFVVGNNGAIWVSWVQGGGAWQRAIAISPGNSVPGAGLTASAQFGIPNQTDVFAVENDGATYVSWVQGAGTWQSPHRITPTGVAQPGAQLASSPQFGVANQTDVFAVENDGTIDVSWVQGAGPWQGTLAITKTGFAGPGVALAASNQFGIPNQTDVFVVGSDGATHVSWVDGAGAWKGPMQI